VKPQASEASSAENDFASALNIHLDEGRANF
jgi:hypothetical protein